MYVYLGVVAPPAVAGDPAQIQRQLAELDGMLHVETVAKLFLTVERAQEIVKVLSAALVGLEEATHAGRPA